MIASIKNIIRKYQTKFSFGTTSAIITNLALITGLNTSANAKMAIIGGILVIAVADNISDSLGIHVYQESECKDQTEVWVSTITNFLSRFLVSLVFIFLVALLPMNIAMLCSILWGGFLLSIMSYYIAKNEDIIPLRAIAEHLCIAAVVIIASHFIGKWLISRF